MSASASPPKHELTKDEMIAILSKGANTPVPQHLLDCDYDEIALVYHLHNHAMSASNTPLGRAEELDRVTKNLMSMEGKNGNLDYDNIVGKATKKKAEEDGVLGEGTEEEEENSKDAGSSSPSQHWAVGGKDGINVSSVVKLFGLTGNGSTLNNSLGIVQQIGAERLTIKLKTVEEGRVVRVKVDNLILIDEDGEEESIATDEKGAASS
jgi:hypothetical protein